MKRRDFIKAAGLVGGTAVAGRRVLANDLPFVRMFLEKKPNILLIIADEQSADAMSCRMGNRFINTPAMDSLAARGVFFSRAYAPNPLCVPARTSIFSGQYPHVTGVQTNSDITKPMSPDHPCLATYFREAGYETGYLGKWHMPWSVKEISVHGFEYMDAIKNIGIDSEIPPRAAAFIQRKREKPFFLVTSFVDPHNICEWARGENLPDGAVGDPPPIDQCPPAVENSAPMIDETDTMLLMRQSFQANRLFPVGDFDEKKWRQYRWAYFRMIEKVDAYIGTILGALRGSDQLENTIVVFVTDHGDMQGAHGWNQKTVLYDGSSRVPLIICVPGMKKAQTCDRLVNTGIDLLPTLCNLAGVSIPSALPGMSLKRSVEKSDIPDPRTYVVSENKMIQGSAIDGQKPEPAGRMVRSKRFKYCVYDFGERRESLVDMEKDPGEMVNLAGKNEYKEELERHRQYLAEWCRENKDSFALVH
ncbi:MAG: sulfatase-like hydrolase/transferase [Ignavibacteriales bacterium]|nr:sulfatase-like hydrolase/transferase [Ignavibacteriales bacterium]